MAKANYTDPFQLKDAVKQINKEFKTDIDK